MSELREMARAADLKLTVMHEDAFVVNTASLAAAEQGEGNDPALSRAALEAYIEAHFWDEATQTPTSLGESVNIVKEEDGSYTLRKFLPARVIALRKL
jgi:hypothetical protein